VTYHQIKVVLLTLLLAGCGGSGGSGEADRSGDAAEVSAQNSEQGGGGEQGAEITLAHCSETDFAMEMLASINSYRAQARFCGNTERESAPALSWNCALEISSRGHSEDMASNNFHDHTGSDGLRVHHRVTNAGYSWWRVGENIAGGQASIAEVMEDWIESEGHCNNIMNPGYTEVGAALAINKNAYYHIYWTQNFAQPYD